MILFLQLTSLFIFLLACVDSAVQTMAPARTEDDGFAVSIPEVPVTEERTPFIDRDGDKQLKYPGT